MRKFKIEFEAQERNVYTSTVKAKTPEEALSLFEQDPSEYDSDCEDMLENDNIPGTAEVVGEWIEDSHSTSSHLKRFEQPVKSKRTPEPIHGVPEKEVFTLSENDEENTDYNSSPIAKAVRERQKKLNGRMFDAYQHFLYYIDVDQIKRVNPWGEHMTKHFLDKLRDCEIKSIVSWVQDMTPDNQDILIEYMLEHHSGKGGGFRSC
jgi:hypothetical protein